MPGREAQAMERLKEKGVRGRETKRIAGMVERSHSVGTKVLHFHDGTASDMLALMASLWVSQCVVLSIQT